MRKNINNIKHIELETSEGPIKAMLLSQADQNIIKSFTAATGCLNPKRGDWVTPETIDRRFVRVMVVKMYFENYFLYGASWDVDEDAMTDDERELWEQAGEDILDMWASLPFDEVEEILLEWEQRSREDCMQELIISQFEEALETI